MKALPTLILCILPSVVSLLAEARPDPAPPVVYEKKSTEADKPAPFDRLTFHQAPKPLSPHATVSDWPRFLGPKHHAQSPETHLLHDWPQEGPKLLWEMKKGDSYTSPVILGERLLVFHALEGRETLECLHPETGQRYWSVDYPIQYRDRYGFGNGPRGSPVVSEGKVFTLGVTSLLSCVDLQSGTLLWQRDLRKEFHVPQDFFGHGSSPLVMQDRVIVHVGGKAGPVPEDDTEERHAALAKPGLSVAAFDLHTGRLVWGVKDAWGASYASPVPATLQGRDVVLLYAGGESNPATGGLLCLDPSNGNVFDRFPWRAAEYIQAIGSSPVVIPERHRVFISTAYPKRQHLGGVMVEFDAQLRAHKVWESSAFATHWMNPLYWQGHLYGIDGETESQAQLVCFDANNGTERWRQELTWEDLEMQKGRPAKLGIQRASLLRVDGKTLCLGESGTLLWLDLSPAGCKIEARSQLFYAPHTWCLPSLSRGLLYVMQNYEEQVRGKTGQRLLCYDLRKP